MPLMIYNNNLVTFSTNVNHKSSLFTGDGGKFIYLIMQVEVLLLMIIFFMTSLVLSPLAWILHGYSRSGKIN